MRQSEPRYTAIQWPWLVIFIWCAMWFFAFYMIAVRGNSPVGVAIAGLMALLGVNMGWRRVRIALDIKKFGDISLTPRLGAPARPGGRFVGLLGFQDKFPAMPEIEAEIRCQHVTWCAGTPGKAYRTEEVVWSSRGRFPLRRRGLGAGAEISFDIPSGSPPTDLAEEHGDEFDRFRGDGWASRHFHRWEVIVAAELPGIDLARGFAIVIEPDPATATTDKSEAVVAAPPPRGIRDSKWFTAVFVLGFMGVIFGPFVFFLAPHIIVGSPAPGSLVPAPLSIREYVVPEPVLPPKTPWITDTSTWSMPMQQFAPYLGIAANGIHRTRANGRDRFSFDEIVIEKNPGRAEVTYLNPRIHVTYHDQESDDTRSTGGFDKEIEDIRGKLTAENPVLVLRNLSVEGPHPKGHIARTRFDLAVNAVSGHRKQVQEVSRHITGR